MVKFNSSVVPESKSEGGDNTSKPAFVAQIPVAWTWRAMGWLGLLPMRRRGLPAVDFVPDPTWEGKGDIAAVRFQAFNVLSRPTNIAQPFPVWHRFAGVIAFLVNIAMGVGMIAMMTIKGGVTKDGAPDNASNVLIGIMVGCSSLLGVAGLVGPRVIASDLLPLLHAVFTLNGTDERLSARWRKAQRLACGGLLMQTFMCTPLVPALFLSYTTIPMFSPLYWAVYSGFTLCYLVHTSAFGVVVAFPVLLAVMVGPVATRWKSSMQNMSPATCLACVLAMRRLAKILSSILSPALAPILLVLLGDIVLAVSILAINTANWIVVMYTVMCSMLLLVIVYALGAATDAFAGILDHCALCMTFGSQLPHDATAMTYVSAEVQNGLKGKTKSDPILSFDSLAAIEDPQATCEKILSRLECNKEMAIRVLGQPVTRGTAGRVAYGCTIAASTIIRALGLQLLS